MPHAHKACQKREIKYAYLKKVCHMQTRRVEKKRSEEKNIAHVQEKNIIQRDREIDHPMEFIHYPPKISTHLHILIKAYDLFLL